jgi:hypothetical protein
LDHRDQVDEGAAGEKKRKRRVGTWIETIVRWCKLIMIAPIPAISMEMGTKISRIGLVLALRGVVVALCIFVLVLVLRSLPGVNRFADWIVVLDVLARLSKGLVVRRR